MIKTILIATLALTPAVAAASESAEFTHEGTNYAYTTEKRGDVTVITGRSSSGEPFRLTVKGNRVTGTYDSRSVSFTTADAKQAGILPGN